MSIATGVARMFSTAPVTPMGADGKMALADHLRELRGRLLRAICALIVGGRRRVRVLRPRSSSSLTEPTT